MTDLSPSPTKPRADRLNAMACTLPASLAQAVLAGLEDWRIDGKVARFWARDSSLWTETDEDLWLAWLHAVEDRQRDLRTLTDLQAEILQADFRHILLLGMGGSSLGPEVLAKTFGRQAGFPELLVLDSTDPAQIAAFEGRLDLRRTLFVVSSKSGGTLEPNILKDYFFDRVVRTVSAAQAGSRFIAITDPGSKLAATAKQQGFRHIFYGDPAIGGRYSVLSNFGLVPAALMGIDPAGFLDRADAMVHACGANMPPAENPGVHLGLILGLAGTAGRDKVTIVASPGIADIGAWLEQLIAESTGKQGKALIPLADEPPGAPAVYGNDRLFAYLRLRNEADAGQDAALAALEAAGQPVVRIDVLDRSHIGQEFFRWEIATAVAGAVLGINPFDQPDVEASKLETQKLTAAYEKSGSLPPESPILREFGLALFADPRNAEALAAAASAATVEAYMQAHLARLGPGDYCALLAYIDRNGRHIAALQHLRTLIRDRRHNATCVGFGPRFLHSTGQAYKGGPNTGLVLQITCDDPVDLAVPGHKYTFGIVKAAQARGDFDVLADRQRRALRVHLGSDVAAGLAALTAIVDRVLT